jgi:hypothetical protein
LENSIKHRIWGCFHSRYSAVEVLFSSRPFYIFCPAMTLPLFSSPIILYTVLWKCADMRYWQQFHHDPYLQEYCKWTYCFHMNIVL